MGNMKSVNLNKLFWGVFCSSVILVIFLGVLLWSDEVTQHQQKIVLGGEEINVILADTPVFQERGLSGRTELKENEGMLFVFTSPARLGFWMKDMLFPIDIIWFDAEQKIVDVWENAQPRSYPEIRTPKKDAQYVLEVPAHFVQRHNIEFGQKFELAQ